MLGDVEYVRLVIDCLLLCLPIALLCSVLISCVSPLSLSLRALYNIEACVKDYLCLLSYKDFCVKNSLSFII